MLENIVDSLPPKWQPYAKTIMASLVALLTAITAAVPEVPKWITIVLAVISAPAVFATPNKDPNAEKQAESVQPPEASPAVIADPASEEDTLPTVNADNADGNGL